VAHPHAIHSNKTRAERVARSIYQQASYLTIRSAIAAVGVLPVRPVVDLAGALGRTYASFDRRRMRRAVSNLSVAFPGWDKERLHETAAASHEHLFKLGVELAYSPRLLTDDSWPTHLELGELAPGLRALISGRPCILITGHCGNWELLGYAMALMGFPMHALYRPLDLPPLDRYVFQTRQRRGLTLVDKFGALRQLPRLLAAGAPLGFVADQNGGDRALFVPFFNRLASTYKSIGLLALQFNATIVCGYARRLERARPGTLGYRLDVADVFGPEEWSAFPDPLYYLTARYRRAIETMIRWEPEQYLWMHRVWRSRPRHERSHRPFPEHLAEKIRMLPWTTEEDLERIKDQSARDTRTLAETGQDKLS
jgi:KDO2-lipid IV(A) lauroyltransferase